MATKKEVKENGEQVMIKDLDNEQLCKISLLKKINEFRKEMFTKISGQSSFRNMTHMPNSRKI